MKTVIAKLLTLLMVLMAVLTMAACGSKSEEQPKEETAVEEKAEEPAEEEAVEEEVVEEAPVEDASEDYTGTYVGQFDISNVIKEQLTQTIGFEIDEPLYLPFLLDLNEDETFKLTVDSEKMKADLISIMKNHIDDFIAIAFEKQGYTMDDLDDIAKASGYDSEDAYKQAMAEQLEKTLDESISFDDYKDKMEVIGTYSINDKTIILKSDDGSLDKVTINDDGSLTLIAPTEEQEFTLIMTKQ